MDPQLLQVTQLTWSRDGRVVDAEGACQLTLGCDGAALIGLPLHKALGIAEARARELEQKALAAPGTVEFVASSLGKDPTVLRLVLSTRDGQGSAGIINMRSVLAGAPPLQISRLASSLSHEIRNPLSSVKMAVQTLARNPTLSERDQRRLVIANREIRNMERMLWLLSEYGRDSSPSLEPIAVRSLVQEAATLVEPELAERRIELRIEEEAPHAWVRVEAGRIHRVLSQLLLSIAMGQPEGSAIAVTIRQARHDEVQILVVDSAAQAPEETSSIFEPFGSMLARGAGLSLAALRWVMESHGGKVTADWSSPPGTLYTLSFPA